MSDDSSDSSEFDPGISNPFTRHGGCNHGTLHFKAKYGALTFDFFAICASIDHSLSHGDVEQARRTLWGAGHLMELLLTGQHALAVETWRRTVDLADAELDDELQKLLEEEGK